MKRLTERRKNGAINVRYATEHETAIHRLAAIEDVLCDGENEYDLERLAAVYNQRMTMREEVSQRFSLTAKIPLDRLREIAEADREGRVIAPPVKIGDTVYHITTCKNFAQVYDGTLYDADGWYGTATGLYCPYDLAENCPFPLDDDGDFDCDKHKNALAIFEDIVTGIHIDGVEDGVIFEYSGGADFEDFGKTVFLAREAAEEALKARGQE